MIFPNREKIIEWLIDNDMDYIQCAGGLEWLRFALQNGFEGYSNQTDNELMSEILERNPDFINQEESIQ
jgi:hypothetical protein